MKLKGKVAVVTGGARDIGRAICVKLAQEGAKVVVNYFGSKAECEKTIATIKAAGGEAVAAYGDVSKLEDINNIVGVTKDAFGDQVDILVNNAGGLFARKTIEELDESFVAHVMDVNFKGTVFATQAFKPLMVSGGAIINIASQAGRDGGGPGSAIYAASKGAVMTLTRNWAKELGPHGIRINAVCPGMIATKFHDDFTKNEVRQHVANSTPLRREGGAEEVADLVAYLATEESSFMTGNSVDINGGLAFS
ncbi:MAG: glucose 1-dehydrogenase [Cyclobacteriaceae bacterium]